jgi:hypothetical protein
MVCTQKKNSHTAPSHAIAFDGKWTVNGFGYQERHQLSKIACMKIFILTRLNEKK